MGYGTGAIMAVPGQDQRDWDFSKKFGLPVIRTVQPPADFTGEAYPGEGPAINSEYLDGLGVDDAKRKIIAKLEQSGMGRGAGAWNSGSTARSTSGPRASQTSRRSWRAQRR